MRSGKMNNEKCFHCIKNGVIQKEKFWRDDKLTLGEEMKLSRILESACSYTGINVKEIAAAAIKEFCRSKSADEYLKRAAVWKPGQLWI
jgi:hypothetical protein